MKNIHILPTDKPSELYSFYGMLEDLSYGKTFTTVSEESAKINLHKNLKEYQEKLIKANWKAENIYITSDEEPKNEDWIYDIKLKQIDKYLDTWCELAKQNARKIILTTDPDLIEEGVQPIDDEFLEWFVKNSSCEFVEVKKGFADGSDYGYNFLSYKIIIPKEIV